MYITNAFISWKKCLNKLNVDTLSLSVFSKVESLSVGHTWNLLEGFIFHLLPCRCDLLIDWDILGPRWKSFFF